ncbi:helicase-related protein [Ruminiclostridium cellobioparum]|uniref:helicase-related protein n=1 Tax=Ruminiclostridium cellobioparum TaxID=29355 RepID=UPI000687E864|nr:helicase C-terminal domain-containing protein [Ruminiclostridium cellobioparum]
MYKLFIFEVNGIKYYGHTAHSGALPQLNVGILENEICIIHDAKTKKRKESMFSAMRTSEKRIILGSTSKMGTGTNIQNKLVALHHRDCPWRPADIEQRDGRILRQGNENEEVEIFRYVTKDTFDAYLWQIVEQKQRFISQVMTSKSISRSCEDIDEVVLNYAEIKALAMGDPRIKEKMDLDIEINKLPVLKAVWSKQRYSLQDSMVYSIPKNVKANEEKIEALKQDIQLRDNNRFQEDQFRIILNNQIFTTGIMIKERMDVIMTHIVDEKMKDFIDKELSEISQNKDRVTEEKRRIRTEIFKLYKVEYSERTHEQNKRLEILQDYDNMLVKQYDLLCKRDIALFQMVAGIGKMSMESECRVNQELYSNEDTLDQ